MGRKIKVKKIQPIVTYCGSTVQQNHGEMLENHGYLLWDLENKSFKEVDIYNNYGYLTIDVENGVIPQWVYDEKDTKLPIYPRIRLRFKETSNVDVKIVIGEIKSLFKSAEITVTRTDALGKMHNSSDLNLNIVGDVADVTVQDELLVDYMDRKFNLTDETIGRIIELNHDVNSRLNQRKVAKNILWKPKTFEFDNMFSYGPNNRIKFGELEGIIGVFANNRMGKSSMFDALSFCMFDRSSRTKDAKHIINNSSDYFYCKFNFQINNVDFFIERNAKWTKSGKNLKVNVDFYKVEDGIRTSLNGEQRRDTNKIIEEYIGTFDDFILTTLSLQGNDALFIDKSQAERKEVLSQIIGVNIFDKLHQIAVDDSRDNSTIIRKFKKDDFPTQLVQSETELEQIGIEIDDNDEKISKVQFQIDNLYEEIENETSKIIPIENDTLDADKLKRNLQDLSDKLSIHRIDIGKLHNEILELESKQYNLEDEVDLMNPDEIMERLSIYNNIVKEVGVVKHEFEKLSLQKQNLDDRKQFIDRHEYNPECDICVSNSKHIIEDEKQLKIDLEKYETDYERLENKRLELKEQFLKIQSVKEESENLQKLQTQISTIEKFITRNVSRVASLEDDIQKMERSIDEGNRILEDYNKNVIQIEQNKKIRNQINVSKDKLKVLSDEMKQLDNERLRLHAKSASVQSKIDVITKSMNEVRELEEENERYSVYLSAMNKDGISYELIEKSLPILEGQVNNILNQVVDFGMTFKINGRNIISNLVYDGKSWPLELASGMERFISGLAIRVALINISNLPAPNFLVIDEGLGTLDSDSLAQLHLVFDYLKTQFDFVIIISHLDVARDMVDDSVTIKKVNGLSNIRF